MSEEGRNRGQRRQSERSERPPSAPAAATHSGTPMTRTTARAPRTMIPNDLDLDDEAKTKLQHIDACLDAMDEEAQRLLDKRSELIERHS